jgi:hypothetical protein
MSIRDWLVAGHVNNWQTSFSQPIPLWGLRERYFNTFQLLNSGDHVVFYATSPVKGVIGLGAVKDKYVDRQILLWPEEIHGKRVIWPLRFRIEVWHLLPEELWKTTSILIADLGLNLRTGFQELRSEHFLSIEERVKKDWGVESMPIGPTIVTPAVKEGEAVYTIGKPENLHEQAQMVVAEIGKLQHYFTEVEYLLQLEGEQRRIDVVWKREATGAPTFAFEIETSGQIERAIAKLRQAFILWNSKPFLIVPEKEHPKVKNLASKELVSFKESFCYHDYSVFEQLYTKKRDLRDFESKYRIY